MLKAVTFRTSIKAIFFLLFLVIYQNSFAQNKKPKLALVLSGGGAKGVAHIPVLQALDSLGIVPDLIVGNSMGSIVGGLYAMGYSGDSIASIAKNASWNKLIGGKVSLRNVSAEEKSEFNKYLVKVDIEDGNLKLNPALLNDQNLRQFISYIAYPAYAINDFDSLSIPFRAVATDIVNGKEVILSGGNIADAMRASMSIPGAFEPVEYKETLLIDGGILNNFPTDVAKSMGADLIIGSDVGTGMYAKEELNKISALIVQATMLSSNLKNPSNRELCDLLFDHMPNLSASTSDFNKADQIYKEGKIAVANNMEGLVAIANRLKGYPKRTHQLPDVSKEFVLDTILYKNISDANLSLVKARTDIKPNKVYNRDEVIAGLNRAMGTTIFTKIDVSPVVKDGKVGLQLKGEEQAKHQVKASLHYDNYYGAGLLLNYTGRNIIGNASRSLFSFDVSEHPRFLLQHQKNFSHDRNWWWRAEVVGQQLKQELYIDGEKADNIRNQYLAFNSQINRNLVSFRSFVGLGTKYYINGLQPTIDPNFGTNILNLKDYKFKSFEVNAHYSYNSLNSKFYATQGAYIRADLTQSFYNKVDVSFVNLETDKVKGSLNNYTKLAFEYEKRIPISDKFTGILGANASFLFEFNSNEEDISIARYGYGAKYLVGGYLLDERENSYSFAGLNESEIVTTQFFRLNAGLQMALKNKFYVIPHFDIASVGFGKFTDYIEEAVLPEGNWTDMSSTSILMSSGASLLYDSIVGPIKFDVSWVNRTNKIRAFIGIGYFFKPSK